MQDQELSDQQLEEVCAGLGKNRGGSGGGNRPPRPLMYGQGNTQGNRASAQSTQSAPRTSGG